LPSGSFGEQITRPWCEALVELSQPSATDATLDLCTGDGTCAFVVAEAMRDAKLWGPPLGAGALGGDPNGVAASVVGLDNDRMALARAEARLDVASSVPNAIPVRFEWADLCDEDAPWDDPAKRIKKFARAYCSNGLQFLKDPEEALRRIRNALIPGGPLVVSVWAPLRKQSQPVFYAAYLAMVETIDEIEEAADLFAGRAIKPERWLAESKTETMAHFTEAFSFVAAGDDVEENARAIEKLESLLIRAGFDAPDAAVEKASHVKFTTLEDAALACVGNLSFVEEMRGIVGEEKTKKRLSPFWRSFLSRFEAHLRDAVGEELKFEKEHDTIAIGKGKGEGSFVRVPCTMYFAHATAPWR